MVVERGWTRKAAAAEFHVGEKTAAKWVQIFVARPARLVGAVAVHAMARPDDARQALDVEVNQIAGPLMFVTDHRWRRIERTQPIQAGAAQDATHRGPAQAEGEGDPAAVVAQPAKSQNPSNKEEEVRRGERRGREERSRNPARPSAR